MSSATIFQRVVVMRHGRRADRDGEDWPLKHERTWDPPLSTLGKKELNENVRPDLRNLNIPFSRIISSPYLRCMQTADIVKKYLKIPEIIIDLSLSEVYDYFNIIRLVSSSQIKANGEYQPMGDWFCKRKQIVGQNEDRLVDDNLTISNFIFDIFCDENVKIIGAFPAFERYIALPFHINSRYCESFENNTNSTDSNLLIVTHMAGINSILNFFYGYSWWIYVRPGDFIIFERSKEDSEKSWGPWKLVPKLCMLHTNECPPDDVSV